METNPEASFSSLPKEIKQLIFSHLNDVRNIIRIQATNREFQTLVWRSITSLSLRGILHSQISSDSNTWWTIPDGFIHAKTVVERLDPSIVTELHLSGFYLWSSTTIGSHVLFFQPFSKLKRLSFDYIHNENITMPDLSHMTELTELITTRVASENTWQTPEQLELATKFFESIPPHVRIHNFAPDFVEKVERPNYNALASDYAYWKEDQIRFSSAKQAVSGLSHADKVIIGFDDGSISVYKYNKEENKLVELATNTTLHGGRINQITQVNDRIIIASSDGKISVSTLVNAGFANVDVFTFPEPIYICLFINTTANTYLAAGKNTIYISVDGIIVRQRTFDSEITGMSHSTYGYVISTRTKYYHGPGTLTLDEIDKLEEDATLYTPNMIVSPDGSLRATVTNTEVKLYDINLHVHLYSFPGKFAEESHLQAYSPIDYWITMSTGHSIATLELQAKQLIAYFTPVISDEDLRRGNIPTIRALWYEHGGNALFSLMSDNTLRHWMILHGPKSYIGQQRAEAEATAQKKQTENEPNPTVIKTMEMNPEASFSSLPKEIKQLIFSHLNDVRDIIRIQATNREFQTLVWRSLTSLDLKNMLQSQFSTSSITWWTSTDGFIHAKTVVERLDPLIVTELHLSGFYLWSATTGFPGSFVQPFSKLKRLSFDFIHDVNVAMPDLSHMTELTELVTTRLAQIQDQAHAIKFFENIPAHIKIRNFVPDFVEKVERPNYNALATDYVSLSKEEKIQFPSTKQAVSGLSHAEKIIIGYDDGSISIYKYNKEENTLVELVMNTTLHGGRINQITQVNDRIIIAASDGKISVSSVVDAGLVPVEVFTFPEPIYMCLFIDPIAKTYLAAGKNTIYISVDGIIAQQRSFDSEITGMSHTTFGYIISTRTKYYRGPGTLKLDETDKLEEDATLQTPNISISPDGSLRTTVTNTEMALYDIERHAHIYSIPGKFAEGAHMQAYNPIDYWITMSTGHSIATLELQSKQFIMYFAPDVSDEDLRRGNFPTIRALWYEHGGNALFSLMSDNTLRWWKIEYGSKAYITEQRRAEAEAAALKKQTENENPNPNPTPDPDPTHF